MSAEPRYCRKVVVGEDGGRVVLALGTSRTPVALALLEGDEVDVLVRALRAARDGPPTSRADPLAGGSALKPSKRVQSGFGHGPP